MRANDLFSTFCYSFKFTCGFSILSYECMRMEKSLPNLQKKKQKQKCMESPQIIYQRIEIPDLDKVLASLE